MNGLKLILNRKKLQSDVCCNLRTSENYVAIFMILKKCKKKSKRREKGGGLVVNRIIMGVWSEKCNFDTCLLGVG